MKCLRKFAHDYKKSPFDKIHIPIEKIDPYLIYALETEDPRLNAKTSSGDVRVMIEIFPLEIPPVDLPGRITAFETFQKRAENGLSVIKAYNVEKHRFVCGQVEVAKFAAFTRNATKLGFRFEVGLSLEAGNTESTSIKFPKNVPIPRLQSKNLIAIIDYGCPFLHPAYVDRNNQSRIRSVWFQDQFDFDPNPAYSCAAPEPFKYGKEIIQAQIDWLRSTFSADEARGYDVVGYDLMRSMSSHGGHVMSLAAGWPHPLHQEKAAIPDDAGDADIIFVQLPRLTVADSSGGGMNVNVLDALRYVADRSCDYKNVVINMSFGTHAGPHDGNSMLEQAIVDLILCEREPGKDFNLVSPMGNGFNAAGHAAFGATSKAPVILKWDISADDRTPTLLEIWYKAIDSIKVEVKAPGETVWTAPAIGCNEVGSFSNSSTPWCTIAHVGSATSDSSLKKMVLIAIAPTASKSAKDSCAPYGVWEVRISTNATNTIAVDCWIERDDPIFDPVSDRQSRFEVAYQADDQEPYPNGVISKEKSFNSYASASYVRVVTGIERLSGTSELLVAPYAASGLTSGQAPIPEFVAVTDETDVLLGQNANGNREGAWVRRNGTSVAAPQLTRALINSPAGVFPKRASAVISTTGATGTELSLLGKALVEKRVGVRKTIVGNSSKILTPVVF